MTVVWDAARVRAGLHEIGAARPAFLERLGAVLDERHGVRRTRRQHEVLFGDWAERFLHLVLVVLEQRRDGAGAAPVPPPASTAAAPAPPPASTAAAPAAVPFADAEAFFAAHESLPGLVAKHLTALVAGVAPTVSGAAVRVGLDAGPGRRDRLAAALLGLGATRRPAVLLVRPFSGRMPPEWSRLVRGWRRWARHDDLCLPWSTRVAPDTAWRASLVAGAARLGPDPGLLEAALVLLPYHLPVALGEAMPAVREAALRARPHRPRAVYSSQSLWTHLAFKVLVAEWIALGTRLLYHQHGGWYGLDEEHVAERYEVRTADRYYTWGWSRGDAHTRALPPPVPAPRREPPSYDSLVCFDQPSRVYRLQYFPLPSDCGAPARDRDAPAGDRDAPAGSVERMHAEALAFVAGRRSAVPLRVRPFPGVGWGFAARVTALGAPGVSLVAGGPIAEQYAGSRIVVHSYLGSSWLETLGWDVPTVCFHDPAAYAFRADALPLLDDLRRVGILHDSAASALAHLATIDDDPGAWWGSSRVQVARIAFADRFANFAPTWQDELERELSAHAR